MLSFTLAGKIVYDTDFIICIYACTYAYIFRGYEKTFLSSFLSDLMFDIIALVYISFTHYLPNIFNFFRNQFYHRTYFSTSYEYI